MKDKKNTAMPLSTSGSELVSVYPHLPKETLVDGDLADWITEMLGGTLAFSESLGWLMWDGRVWSARTVSQVRKLVLEAFKAMRTVARIKGAKEEFRNKIKKLRSNSKVKAVTDLLRSTCFVDPEFFNDRPDFINVQNGIVDLRNGELLSHDKKYGFTRITPVEYRAGYTHPDWDAALSALSKQEADWLQVITGQAITGYSSSDDKVNILPGMSSNGKSVWVNGITGALGEYAFHASEKALVGSRWDHPTEKMQFWGRRVVFVEELPEGEVIDGKRLKDLTGRTMAARGIGQNNVNWVATHALFVTTNYEVKTASLDLSIVRRIRLIPFRKTYSEKPGKGEFQADPGLKPRIEQGLDGQHEAALAWAVKGAVRWYRNGKRIPATPKTVEEYTKAWRKDADLFSKFFAEHIAFSESSHVVFTDLLASYNFYLRSHGSPECTAKDFNAKLSERTRLAKKLLRRSRSRSVTGRSRSPFPIAHSDANQPECWYGLKFAENTVRGVRRKK